ncbi:MAG: SDR family oxidoreductase [Arenicellales bacterium]|jgi:glucose 1-dehydrogenase|nr:SDR family oxidoreductase [Arenicellales bacterium]
MKRLTGKSVLITGGSKGIGAACAKLFAAEGARVAINYSSDKTAAEKTLAQITSNNGDACAYRVDMCDIDGLTKVWENVLNDFGGIDILVLNAAYQKKKVVDDTDLALLEKTYRVNVIGNFHLARQFVDHRRSLKQPGVVIVHGSGQGEFVNPTGFAYALSKAALHHMVRHLAVAWAKDQIRVNGVQLGWFNTEGERRWTTEEQMRTQAAAGILMGRAGEPIEAARLSLYLASDESSYMTGSIVCYDGGFALAPDLST